ncbi:MAG: hypothetical protein AAB618_00720 [Patescibacteria group bacterium]
MKKFTAKSIYAAIAAFFTVLFLAETNFNGTVQNPLDSDLEDNK